MARPHLRCSGSTGRWRGEPRTAGLCPLACAALANASYDAHDFKPSEAPAGALLACVHGDLVCRALGDRGDWRRISSRTEPDATTSFEVFEKTHPDQ